MIIRLIKLAFIFSSLIGFFHFQEISFADKSTEQTPAIRGVLFYSPTCGHCHKVITEDLPPLFEKYGEQLQIIGINVNTEDGQSLFHSFFDSWQIPKTKQVVPILVVDDIVMVGSLEIPQQLPGVIEKGLESGGIEWPDIPGLEEILENIESESQAKEQDQVIPTDTEESQVKETQTLDLIETDTPESLDGEIAENINESLEPTIVSTDETDQLAQNESVSESQQIDSEKYSTIAIPFDEEITVMDRFKQDLAGNSVAVVVLVAMVVSVIWGLIKVIRTSSIENPDWSRFIPLLSVLGLVIAGYLSFIEVTHAEAFCGPVGDCNSVQQSPYAVILGFLPIGVLGLIGFAAILISWILKRYGPDSWNQALSMLIWAMALFGVIFSIYLTYLEPFVIGATCMWCISSAIIITLQFLAATEPVRRIWMLSEDESEF